MANDRNRASSINGRTEKLLSAEPSKPTPPSDVELRELVHDLSTYKIELEMQNAELRRSREELEESHNEYAALYDFAPVGYLTFDETWVITKVNLTAAGFFGIERSRLVNTPLAGLIQPQSQDTFYFYMRSVLAAATTQICQLVLERKDGTSFDAQLESIAVPSEGGVVIRSVLTDVTERRRAERALRESEEQYRLAVESINDGVAVVQEDKYILVNQRYLDMFGYASLDELADQPAEAIVHLEDRERIRSYTLMARRGESTPSHYEFKGIRKGGEIIQLEVSTSVITRRGRPAGLGFFRDVTEKRRSSEEDLDLSRQRTALHVEQTPLCVIEWDADFRIAQWNRSAEEIFGYGRDEAIGHHYDFIAPESARRRVHAADEASMGRRGRPHTLEENVTKDGTVIICRWFNTTLIDRDGRTLGAASLVEDVTEREKAEQKLQAAAQKYRIVADNTYDWEFWTSPVGDFLYVSPACETISGYPPEAFEADPRLLERITHPEDRAALLAHMNKVLTEPQADRLAFRVIRPDGGVRSIEHVCQPVWSDNGEFLGSRGSNRDATDRNRLEDQLAQARKLEAVGTLAGGVAHDFNNILMVIMSCTDLMQMDPSINERLLTYVNQIAASSERAAGLTKRLLSFSREQESALEPCSMNDIVTSSTQLLKRLMASDIELSLDLTDEDVTVRADAAQMDQVLMNLATNARDAMSRGGLLTFKTEVLTLSKEFRERYGFGRPGRYVCLSVADSGAGMDAKTMERVFDPFFTTKEVGRGTGLGLSSVYGTVKRHEGYITITSNPGHGTNVCIYLPLIELPS